MITISNQIISAEVSTTGAEVQSIKGCQTGREYMWNGDEKWWHGHSPILFPIVGGMWNGTCRIDGQEVQIPKHGIVRRATWVVDEVKADSVTMSINSTVASFKIFPFAYNLSVTYSLQGRKLVASFVVKNLSGCELWFQLGGHPAIALPDWDEANEIDGYLQLEGQPQHVLRAGEQGCLESSTYEVPMNADGLVPLSVTTFSHEALIFDEKQIKAATVLDRHQKPVARVACDAPVWLFWSPQGVHSPFVCCEPWYGLCDAQGYEGDVQHRPYMNHVASGESWTAEYSIEVF